MVRRRKHWSEDVDYGRDHIEIVVRYKPGSYEDASHVLEMIADFGADLMSVRKV